MSDIKVFDVRPRHAVEVLFNPPRFPSAQSAFDRELDEITARARAAMAQCRRICEGKDAEAAVLIDRQAKAGKL